MGSNNFVVHPAKNNEVRTVGNRNWSLCVIVLKNVNLRMNLIIEIYSFENR